MKKNLLKWKHAFFAAFVAVALVSCDKEEDPSQEPEFTQEELAEMAAAEKFAADSESKLGKIQTAHQGVFSITDRDMYTPHIKNVRVVTSVNYYLEE